MTKEQLNKLLVERKLCDSIDCANRRIVAREVKVADDFITAPCFKVPADSVVTLKETCEYVSRGGLKLRAAITEFDISVTGKKCLDIGSSTGGFTDCLLKEGAGEVTCVDVNYGQLAWEVRTNERVKVFERTNIKHVQKKELGAPFDIIVIDVSFIGLASLAPVIANLCYEKQDEHCTELVALVKPEFEAKKEESEGGKVEDPHVRIRTVEEVKKALVDNGFDVKGEVESPIRGKKKGNTEHLIYAKH